MIWWYFFGCNTNSENICSVVLEHPIPNSAKVYWVDPLDTPLSFSWTDEFGIKHSETFKDGLVELSGLLANFEFEFQIETAETLCTGAFKTDVMPFYFPTYAVRNFYPERMSPEKYILGVFVIHGFGYTAFVIDREGRPYWMYHEEARMSAMIERDIQGSGVVLNSYPNDLSSDDGQILYINRMGEVTESIQTPLGHHAFMQFDDGTLAWPAFDIRSWYDPDLEEDVLVSGDTIVERSPDGQITEVFNSWDWLEVTKHERWEDAFLYPGAHDWTHANSLIYFEDRDRYLLSLPYIQTIIEVDRTSGEMVQEIAPHTDSFPAVPYVFQHFPVWLEDEGLLLVSHEENGTAVIEYEWEEGQLSEVWSHGRDGQIFGNVLGQATRLSNGNTLMNYGGAGLIQEVAPDNTVVWELYTGMGIWMGSGQLISELP